MNFEQTTNESVMKCELTHSIADVDKFIMGMEELLAKKEYFGVAIIKDEVAVAPDEESAAYKKLVAWLDENRPRMNKYCVGLSQVTPKEAETTISRELYGCDGLAVMNEEDAVAWLQKQGRETEQSLRTLNNQWLLYAFNYGWL